ncbi:hypothetical protein [Phytohabitans rumicis]|uniref:Uncharacterized protein n=1 Tax=Phytohabitans rumicis TaxID=1076125 RepID=A0A6V8L9X2_9ACTN|nr:hypothetical protein [Phytohabitans rumicis]GFJ92410.1 hypothetical protein Prum_060520 [Phytohabitans rumicis]
MASWEQVREHLKQIEDFLVADRDGEIAEAEREAAAAASRGDEWWRKFYEDRLGRLKGHRFSWETERDTA